MSTMRVPGLGDVEGCFVESRGNGQSITCAEKRSSLSILNDCPNVAYFVKLDHGYFPQGDACDYCISTLNKLRQIPSVLMHFHTAVFVPSGGSLMPSAEFQKYQQHFRKQTNIRLLRLHNHSNHRLAELVSL